MPHDDLAEFGHMARRLAERFLIARLRGKEFALRAAPICGMVQMRGLDVQACSGPDGWNYQVNLHGRTLPVFTPQAETGSGPRSITARTTLLLVESEEEDSAPAFGLKVDSVSRFEDVPPAHIRRGPEGFKVLLNEKWRPVINLTEVAVRLYEWSRERKATTI